MNLRIPAAIAAVSLSLVALAGAPAQAETRTGSVQFINDVSNPSSFDCYVYQSGSWKKINDGSNRVIARSTPFKCDARYRLVTFTGAKTTIKDANKAYYLGSIDIPFNMITARKA